MFCQFLYPLQSAICTLLVVLILYATFLPYQALDMVNLLTLLLDMLPSLCLSSQQSKSMLRFLNYLIFVYFYIVLIETIYYMSPTYDRLPNLSINFVCM